MVGYIRVSTDEQNLGPDAQRASLKRWAMNRGLEIAGMFEDRGVSGATALDLRPGLLAAIESVRASGAKFLVAAKLERLAARHGAQLISADGLPAPTAFFARTGDACRNWIDLSENFCEGYSRVVMMMRDEILLFIWVVSLQACSGVDAGIDSLESTLNYSSSGDSHVMPTGSGSSGSSGTFTSCEDSGLFVTVGAFHVCAMCTDTHARVRCWGQGLFGQTGHGNNVDIGDNELPISSQDLLLDGSTSLIEAGVRHTCAITLAGTVTCWGDGAHGKLGSGSIANVGDIDGLANAVPLVFERRAVGLALGLHHSCALLEHGEVKCWGFQVTLGYAATEDIGDDELAIEGDAVDLGGDAIQIDAGTYHTCALLTTGAIRCWGDSGVGQLGYGDKDVIEPPSLAGDVTIGGSAVDLAAGSYHNCAVLNDGKVQCWGFNEYGQLGLGYASLSVRIGDDESPASAGPVLIMDSLASVTAGDQHTCAVTANREVRCWGARGRGQTGHGGKELGPDQIHPESGGTVEIGGDAQTIRAGGDASCVVLSSGQCRCWGYNKYGKLGQGHQQNIGDDEAPAEAPPVEIF